MYGQCLETFLTIEKWNTSQKEKSFHYEISSMEQLLIIESVLVLLLTHIVPSMIIIIYAIFEYFMQSKQKKVFSGMYANWIQNY